MPPRFVFSAHNHQPVGNFDGVFEQAFNDCYGPFLHLIEHYPEIPISLHTSGPLMEWLYDHKRDYIDRLRRLVERGQVEILGGGFYEPIMTMIPSRDRVGQIRTYRGYLENLFQTRVRGMWIPERVWEQSLVADLVAAGVEYTVLDDYHFRQAGADNDRLFGYYLTEDSGKLLRVFPISEAMRYLVPWQNPEETFRYLGELAGKHADPVIVCADDGEKFGGWPETHKHCYQDGWLWRFFDGLRHASGWVRMCTFSQALDETEPIGKIYIPDCSYREMTEWALPTPRQKAYYRQVGNLEREGRLHDLKPFIRGGFWRNFKVKYPETEEMYARMMQVSKRLEEAEHNGQSLSDAQQSLYRAQCNCPWWHGTFGGLYLPHLRHAVWEYLIRADNALLAAEHRPAGWVDQQTADFNLDGADEVYLGNSRLAAFFRPRTGGCLYELDVRPICRNLLATLSRRPESYHDVVLNQQDSFGPNHQRAIYKQADLDRQVHYDRYLRKALIDHFFEPNQGLPDVAAARENELGDFVTGRYESLVLQSGADVLLTLSRQGNVSGAPVKVTKEITLRPGADTLEVRYVLEGLPGDRPLHFGVEFNFACMAAGADDRYFYHDGQARAGQLQTWQDLADADRIGLVDEWLGIDVSLHLSRRGGIWAFPIQTVSQSEGGFELVHQSTAVLPHWHVQPDSQGRWEVTLNLKLDTARAEQRSPALAAV